jgi:hypothetical protein
VILDRDLKNRFVNILLVCVVIVKNGAPIFVVYSFGTEPLLRFDLNTSLLPNIILHEKFTLINNMTL